MALDNEAQLRQLEAEIAAIEAQMLQLEHEKRQRDIDQMQTQRSGRTIRRMSAVQTKHAKRLSMAQDQSQQQPYDHSQSQDETDTGHYDEDDVGGQDHTGSSYNNYYDEVIEEIIEEEILEEEHVEEDGLHEDEEYAVDDTDYGYEDPNLIASPISPAPRSNLLAELKAKAAKQPSTPSAGNSSLPLSPPPLVTPTTAPTPPSQTANSLLGDMLAAVGKRNERVATGDLVQQNIAQTAVAPTETKQPTGFDLAALVASAASEREARLAQGGEKRMTQVVIKEEDEYRHDFKNVAVEAAELGRLTRLNEHVVEAVATEKSAVKDAWQSKGLMAIEWRTNHMAIIHEAAALGNETKMREYVTTNYDDEEEEDFFVDEATQYKRMRALAQAEGASKVEHFIALQKLLDAEDATRGIVRPMYMYNDITKVVLPKGRLPKLDQTKGLEEIKKMSHPLTEISNDVIQRALDRMQRLKNEEAEPRMRTVCNCGYCDTASPFQTFAYRVVEGRVKGVHIPKELLHEMGRSDGKKYKVRGKGGTTRVTRAIKADATGEIDKDQHFYVKMKEKAAQEERERLERAKPRVRRGRVTRDGAPAPARSPAKAAPTTISRPSTPARTSPQDDPNTLSRKEQLAAEIAAMEKEIERQRLQAEIKQMETAIDTQQKEQQVVESPATPDPTPPIHENPVSGEAPPSVEAVTPLPAAQTESKTDTGSSAGSGKKKGLIGRMFGRKK